MSYLSLFVFLLLVANWVQPLIAIQEKNSHFLFVKKITK